MPPKPGWLTMPRVTLGALAVLTSAVAAQQVQTPVYPETRKTTRSTPITASASPIPTAGSRTTPQPRRRRGSRRRTRSRSRTSRRFPSAPQLRDRVMQLNDYEKYSAPSQKGPYFFFSKNDGLQNQSVLYIQKGLDGTPEVLIDPNTWSADGTVRLSAFVPSKDAKYAVYGISQQRLRLAGVQGDGAGDEEDAARHDRVGQGLGRRLARRRLLLQPLSGAGKGQEKASINENHQVYFHKIGTPQSQDVLVYQDAANPQRFHIVDDDRGRALRGADDLGSRQGQGRQRALRARPVEAARSEFTPLIPTIGNDTFGVIDNVGDKLLVEHQPRARRTAASC